MADNINATLEELAVAINQAVACCEAKGATEGGVIDPPPTDGTVEVGEGTPYEDLDAYNEAKCHAANVIFDSMRSFVVWLDNNHGEALIGAFGGLTTAIILGLLASGPVGILIVATDLAISAIVGLLGAYAFDFESMTDALDDVQAELVLALFNSGSVSGARDAFLTILAGATPTLTSTELLLVELCMTNALLNELLYPTQRTVEVTAISSVDCIATTLQTWTFTASGEGWTYFEDFGNITGSAQWVSARGAWEVSVDVDGPGYAACGVQKESLAIAVDVGNSVRVDYGGPSDGLAMAVRLYVNYSDTSQGYKLISATDKPGVITVNVDGSKTISSIQVSFGGATGRVFTVDVTEVRVQ